QKGGVPDDKIIEVHGTTLRVMCMACGLRTPSAVDLDRLDEESDPRCVECGGIQKSDTISVGQRLAPEDNARAAPAARECDAVLAVSTPFTVHPVAGLCDVAMMSGARLMTINAEPPPSDDFATVALHDPIGQVGPALVKKIPKLGHGIFH